MAMKYLQTIVADTYSDLPSSATGGQYAYVISEQVFYVYINSAWQSSARVLVKKSATNVNGLSVASTKIYTLETSALNFYPIMVTFRKVTVTGTTVTPPSVSVGSNSTSYDNISSGSLLSTALAGLGANGGAPQMATFSPPLASATDIYAKVGTAAIGPSVYTFLVEIVGFYDV